MRDILTRLPMLPLTKAQDIDFPAADGDLLVAIADDAEMMMGAVHLGVGAIGHLPAHSAVMIEDGSISADCIESLGFLIAEICDMAASFMLLAATVVTTPRTMCRRLAETPQAATKSSQAAFYGAAG